jgi:poly-gamma-glutamate system protein
VRRTPIESRIVWEMAFLFFLSVAAVALAQHFRTADPSYTSQMLTASEDMKRALDAVAADRTTDGPPLDPVHDVNLTGMIGGLFTSTTSTTGNLAAKRTTTNPNVAGLIVHLLHEAGVREGDYVAVGGSGSFPALVVASLCAAKAMNLEVGLIVSLGASQWGGNLPGLTWLDIEAMLSRIQLFPPWFGTLAASVGGSDDLGSDLPLSGRAALRERIVTGGTPLIEEKNLALNVAVRMEIYRAHAPAGRIAAFINIGGSWANLGTSAEVLALKPGVAEVQAFPPQGSWGVLQTMAAEGVPIIHLLNIAALADEYGIPWDPTPLPRPGDWHPEGVSPRLPLLLVSASYGTLVLAWLIVLWVRARHRAVSR